MEGGIGGKEKEVLRSLVQIPRLWLQQNMAHPFKLPGIAFYDSLVQTIETIIILREKRDHPLLKTLEEMLTHSIDEVSRKASDIAQAQVWLQEITNILLGIPDDQGQRHTKEYVQQISRIQVEGRLMDYISGLAKVQTKYSPFLQGFIAHLRATHNNWRQYLFNCYEHPFLSNTNLELELSHSRMKRKHRRITGLKNSHQFLLTHGEHFAFCLNFESSYNSFSSLHKLLQLTDYELVRSKTRMQREKAKKRGKKRLTLKNLPKRLEEIAAEWE